MAATAEQIMRLRRMVAEADSTTYDNSVIADYIERYPLLDELGEEPYTWDMSTTPPHQDVNTWWVPTYDLNAAAADVWDEKAATVAQDYDYSADGASFSRSRVVEQYERRARSYRARRSAHTIKQVAWPDEGNALDNRPAWLA